MSTVQVALVKVGPHNGTNMVARSVFIDSEVATSSGSSDQLSACVADAATLEPNLVAGARDPSVDGLIWRVAVAGSDSIYVAFGSNPTASSTTGFLCPAGGVYEFAVSAIGHMAAIINA